MDDRLGISLRLLRWQHRERRIEALQHRAAINERTSYQMAWVEV